MALSNYALNTAADAIAAVATHARIHTGDPGASGTSNVSTAGVETLTWGAASGSGDVSITAPVLFTGGTPSGAATHITLWDGDPGSGGTYVGSKALTGDQTFNSAGEYTLTDLDLDGTATA